MLEVFASSSTANAYRWGSLLIEAGLPARELFRAFGTAPLACLVTHEHGDHAKGAHDLATLGVSIVSAEATLDDLQIPERSRRPVEHGKAIKIGVYTVYPLNAVHDAVHPLCFIVGHGDERLLFATDTAEIPYKIDGLTEIAIEANYSQDLLCNSRIDTAGKIRTARSHMSIETAIETLQRWELRRVRRITLLHLSDRHSDAEQFKRLVEAETGRPVEVAPKNNLRRNL